MYVGLNTDHSSPLGMDLLLDGCLTSQQHASVSQGQISSDNFTCCHTEIEVADKTFYLNPPHYTDTRPTGSSGYPISLGDWKDSRWSANSNHWYDSTRKNPESSAVEANAFSSSQRRRCLGKEELGVIRCLQPDFSNSHHRLTDYRLVGLVVKASPSRAEDPGFESRLRRDFSGQHEG